MNGFDPGLWVQLGLAGGLLAVLYFGLARGRIWTDSAVQEIKRGHAERVADKNERIASLEKLVEIEGRRNDTLSAQVSDVLELARAQGWVSALPKPVAERITQ